MGARRVQGLGFEVWGASGPFSGLEVLQLLHFEAYVTKPKS